MKINKWLEASLFKEFIQDVAAITNIYFFENAPVAIGDFPSTEGTTYWTVNGLDSLVLLNIALSPTESYNIGSADPSLDISLQWKSTTAFNGLKAGTANWFLMTNSDKKPIFMGEVTSAGGGGDIELSNNVIVVGQKYKIYKYTLNYNQL